MLKVCARADSGNGLLFGGEGGIRTLGTREGTTDFESVPFGHSGTSPEVFKFCTVPKSNTVSMAAPVGMDSGCGLTPSAKTLLVHSSCGASRLVERRVLITDPRSYTNQKAPKRGPSSSNWRRGRDSNPRYAINVYTLSRRAPSATRTPLQFGRSCRTQGACTPKQGGQG